MLAACRQDEHEGLKILGHFRSHRHQPTKKNTGGTEPNQRTKDTADPFSWKTVLCISTLTGFSSAYLSFLNTHQSYLRVIKFSYFNSSLDWSALHFYHTLKINTNLHFMISLPIVYMFLYDRINLTLYFIRLQKVSESLLGCFTEI